MLRMTEKRESIGLGVLALFTSVGTLVCCALPILLVTLGLGSVVAAVTLHVPYLVALSEYKAAMFTASAGLIAFSGWVIRHRKPCPADPRLAMQCRKTRLWSRRLLLTATAVWLIGLFFSYFLLPLRQSLDV